MSLKGPCHETFDLWFFSSNNSIWAPDTRVKAFLHMDSYPIRYSTMESTFLVVSGVNDTADHKRDPYFLYEWCIYSVVQFAYVRFFDRNFKSSQSKLNFEVP
jgi:hypothetical protein